MYIVFDYFPCLRIIFLSIRSLSMRFLFLNHFFGFILSPTLSLSLSLAQPRHRCRHERRRRRFFFYFSQQG